MSAIVKRLTPHPDTRADVWEYISEPSWTSPTHDQAAVWWSLDRSAAHVFPSYAAAEAEASLHADAFAVVAPENQQAPPPQVTSPS